jgi:hypothetical protein
VTGSEIKPICPTGNAQAGRLCVELRLIDDEILVVESLVRCVGANRGEVKPGREVLLDPRCGRASAMIIPQLRE